MSQPRLQAPYGRLINTQQPITFHFEGKQYQGYAGDTLASALYANGQRILSRSFKYHRPRGVLTMAGQDANTLVQLEAPNQLADRTPIAEGMIAAGQNYNGTLEKDRDAFLDHFGGFMPVGFYYRTFFKPLGVWKHWEKWIRKKAGLGVLNVDSTTEETNKSYLFCDIAIIGAGPAGLQAALTAAHSGANVLLIDEQIRIGGAAQYHVFSVDNNEESDLKDLILQVEQHPTIRILQDATCTGWFADHYLSVIQHNHLYKIRAKATIAATGSFEQHAVFHNNDLPGVMLSSAANRLMRLYGVKPGDRAVVLTGNDDGYLNALMLNDCGVEVAAIVDMRPTTNTPELYEAVTQCGIDVLPQHTVFEAQSTSGHRQLKGVNVHPIRSRGCVDTRIQQYIHCDLLTMSVGYMPAYQLLCQAGATLQYHDDHAEFALQNLPEKLFIAGSVNGCHSLNDVLSDARYAAEQALHALEKQVDLPTKPPRSTSKVNVDWPIFPHPKGKEFIDFDEDLQIKDIVNATRLGYRDVQLVKRFSTVGMGPSQGRHSALPTARLIADATDRSVTETGVTTARPPFAAERLQLLAGRSFTPYRRSALHACHQALGAQMMPAGQWQRPAYYGQVENRINAIQEEAMAVRNRVGIIDVSTLGGIEVRGPDAAELLNRLYTGAFHTLPAAKTRYAVMANEQGVIIDDGVCCCINKQHFYITATTNGVDRIYRNLLKWQAEWRLSVDIANVTSAFAGINIAGPLARLVLQRLDSDIDFSREAFPYLAYREGHIETVPVRVLRVGFVGELGYEIHLPSRFSSALWTRLMAEGKAENIRPFGVEAQRLLRLEKGHLIIGQDSDGMSQPDELSLGWALSKKKPFFVGKRSIEILRKSPLKRKLVGFNLPANSPQPKEGHLVLEDDIITGHVTSCEFSPTLNRIIGLAYVAPQQSDINNTFTIRVDSAQCVQATVTALPFYDADNLRQGA